MKLTKTELEILRSIEEINLKYYLKSKVKGFYILNHLEYDKEIKLTSLGFKRIVNKLEKLELIELKKPDYIDDYFLKLTDYGITIMIENLINTLNDELIEPYALDNYGDEWFLSYNGRSINELDFDNDKIWNMIFQLNRLCY